MPKSGQPWDPSFLLGHPLFEVFEPLARGLRGSVWPSVDDYTRLLEENRRKHAPELAPLRFELMKKKARRQKRERIVMDELYDGSIAEKGAVPCLPESYHDLLNALIFTAFPRAKRTLHARQFAALSRWVEQDAARLPGKRTREQDALTIFDEGGTVLVMTPEFHESWRGASAPLPLPTESRALGVLPLLFGHALLEHLHEGHKAIRSSGIVVVIDGPFGAPAGLLELIDRRVAGRLGDPREFTQPGADSIFEMDAEGRITIGPPKPGWSLWNLTSETTFGLRPLDRS